MTTVQLTDEQWAKLRDFLRSDPHAYLGTDDGACRRCVEAVLWIDRSGAPWRLLPTAYGTWKSVYNRCCGSTGVVRRGACCRPRMAPGRASTTGSHAGAS